LARWLAQLAASTFNQLGQYACANSLLFTSVWVWPATENKHFVIVVAEHLTGTVYNYLVSFVYFRLTVSLA